MRRPTENEALLFGPYRAPKLRRGQRATCYYRDGDVVITTWSDAPITWPRCHRLHVGGPPGLLVDDELARAVKSEAGVAVAYWWGVNYDLVKRWRRSLAVTRRNNPGSCRVKLNCVLAANRARKHATDDFHLWTNQEIALLGTASDKKIAKRIGRSYSTVQSIRNLRGIERFGGSIRRWTKREDAIVRKESASAAVIKTGRSLAAVMGRRHRFGMGATAWWKPSEVKLLGTASDESLAARFGRPVSAVRGKRESLSLEKFSTQRRPWTKAEDKLVRRLAAADVVAKTDRTLLAVYMRRVALGIQGEAGQQWTKKEIALMGKLSDAQVAARVGRTKESVARKRVILGIRRVGGQNLPWTKAEDAAVMKMSVQAAAAKTGRPPTQIRWRRQKLGIAFKNFWTKKELRLLGTMPDSELAVRLGRTRSAILHKRERLGIEMMNNPNRLWTKAEDRIVSQLSNAAAAAKTGRTPAAVKTRRRFLRVGR